MQDLNPSSLLLLFRRVQHLQVVGDREHSEYPVNPNYQRGNCKLQQFTRFQPVPPLQSSFLAIYFPGAYAPGYFMVQTGRIANTLDRAHGIHL